MKRIIASTFILFVSLFLLRACNKAYHGVNEYRSIKLGHYVGVLGDVQTSDYKHYGLKEPQFIFSIIAIEKLNPSQNAIGGCLYDEYCFKFAKKIAKYGGWIEIINKSYGSYHFEESISQEEVESGKIKVIVVLNKDNQIIGIYPGKTLKNLDDIMKDFPQYSQKLHEFKNFKFLEEILGDEKIFNEYLKSQKQ